MTFEPKALGGKEFFKNIRQTMANQGDWLFAGADGDLKYVVMDALFFGLVTIIRPDGDEFKQGFPSALSFTEFGVTLTTTSTPTSPHLRVVVNGNFYDNSRFAYHYVYPGPNPGWKGEIIQNGGIVIPPPMDADAAKLIGHCSFIGRNGQ